jgi:transcriptional regulator with XRE-family HTH domain
VDKKRLTVNAAAIKKLRAQSGLSQRDYAEQFGIPHITYQRLEQGGRQANGRTLAKLAKALGVPVEQLVTDDGPTTAAEESPTRAGLKRYLSKAREIFGAVQFIGMPQFRDNKPLDLTSLYVPPQIADTEILPTYFDKAAKPDPAARITDLTPESLRGMGDRVVFLAGAGYGKSSFVNWLVVQLADPKASNPWRAACEHRIPLPFVLRELRLNESIDTWDKLVQQLIHSRIGQEIDQADYKLIAEALETGGVTILLDGLDEIEPDIRVALHKAIWDGFCRFTRCQWFATSRIQGYGAAPLDVTPLVLHARKAPDTQEHVRPVGAGPDDPEPVAAGSPDPDAEVPRPASRYFVPFDDQRIAAFTTNWYLQRELSPKLAAEKAADLTAALHESEATLHLARVPNLLTLMALIHRVTSVLPKGRAELYDKIVTAYVETIDTSRGIYQGDPDTPAEKRRWLAYVAYQMQRQRSKRRDGRDVAVDRDELLKWIDEAMRETDKDVQLGDAAAFLARVRARMGLMVDLGDDRYAFIHLSFLEYFAAQELLYRIGVALRGRDDRALFEYRGLAADTSWREVIVFAFQTLQHNKDKALHRDVRRALFGDEWETGTLPDEVKTSVRLLLIQLADDPYSWFDLPASSTDPERATLATCVARAITTLSLTDKSVTDARVKAVAERCPRLSSLILMGTNVSDDGVKAVAEHCPDLTHLNLSGTNVSDDGVKAVARRCPRLTSVNLNGARVTDVGVEVVAEHCRQLRTLHIGGTEVTDDGVTAVAERCPDLESLFLGGTRVTDVGVEAVAKHCRQLRFLHIGGTRVADDGVTAVAERCPELESLYLGSTRVTDYGVEAVAEHCPRLTSLNLNGTRVTDVGVEAVAEHCRQLRSLHTGGTRVTDTVRNHLKRSLPDLSIS